MLDATAEGGAGSGLGNVVQGLQDVDQCIRIILTTPKGSDPLRPTFGVDVWQYLDFPIAAARPAMVREVTDAILQWEPRVKLLKVAVTPVVDGSTQSGAHLSVTATWRLALSGSRVAPGIGAQPQNTSITIASIATGL